MNKSRPLINRAAVARLKKECGVQRLPIGFHSKARAEVRAVIIHLMRGTPPLPGFEQAH